MLKEPTNTASSPATTTAASRRCPAYYLLLATKTLLQMKNITNIFKILFLSLFPIATMMGQNPAFVYLPDMTGYSLEDSLEHLKDKVMEAAEQRQLGKDIILKTNTQAKFGKTIKKLRLIKDCIKNY